MAVVQINYTKGALDAYGNAQFTAKGVGDPIASAPASTTVAANIATLVADGASPTQAHVTTLNTNWGTFLTAYNLTIAQITADLTVAINTTNITTQRQALSALRKLQNDIQSGYGGLTP